jgi:hypothetical protein
LYIMFYFEGQGPIVSYYQIELEAWFSLRPSCICNWFSIDYLVCGSRRLEGWNGNFVYIGSWLAGMDERWKRVNLAL